MSARQDHSPQGFVVLTLAVLSVGIAYELFRLIAVPWPNVSYLYSAVVSLILLTLWTATSAALLMRERRPLWSNAAWVLSLMSALAMVAHAGLTRIVSKTYMALPYLALAVIYLLCLRKVWKSRILPASSTRRGEVSDDPRFVYRESSARSP